MNIIYPGSFDPVTNGHLDLIKRASEFFGSVTVAILNNPNKTPLFSLEERKELLELSTKDLLNVTVDTFSGLLVDYMDEIETYIVLRGLRAVSDYENEMRNALANNSLDNRVETLFMVSKTEYTFLSSSLVKEIASYNGKIDNLVPKAVEIALKNKYR